jgi:dihydrofolate synthase/folylpolyglutamate synthase
MTATAFHAFARARVEWVAVEVGMGGRLDSTNAWTGDVAVVTNVGLEHTEVLGDTLEAIATEKAGIVKPGTVLVTPIAASSPAGLVLAARATVCGVPVRWVTLPLAPVPSELNIAVAGEVLDTLGALGLSSRTRGEAVGRADLGPAAIAAAALPGRMERLHAPCPRTGQPLPVVLDGAHVDFALAGVLSELARDPRLRAAPVVLMALGADKQASAMLDVLRRRAASVIFVPLEAGQPCWSTDELVTLARAVGLRAGSAPSPRHGLEHCLAQAVGRWVLATGSLHLVGSIHRLITQGEPQRLALH